MAKYLKKANKKGTIGAAFLFCTLGLVASGSLAQGFVDPTRPPTSIASPVAEGAGPVEASGPVLQSILISPSRVVAIISGQSVKVGDRVGEAKVIKISDNEVTLRTGSDVKVLKLFSNVEKKLSPPRGGLRAESRRP